MPSVTNQQLLLAIGEVKADVANVKETQTTQGQQILGLLLTRAKDEGAADAKNGVKNRRRSDTVVLWTILGSAGTLVATVVALALFVMDLAHKVGPH